MTTPKRLSAETVINAIRTLMKGPAGRTGRAAIIGYLALKSKEERPGQAIEVWAMGLGSVKPELDRFFVIGASSPLPYINPFGLRQGAPDWLARQYERRGVYTHLYPQRTLDRILDVRTEDDHFSVRIPNGAAKDIARELKGRIPLEPAAAFLLRGEAFSSRPNRSELVSVFRQVFHLTTEETDDLFQEDGAFEVRFENTGFTDAVGSLPPDLHPPHASAGQPAVSHATQDLVSLAPTEVGRSQVR